MLAMSAVFKTYMENKDKYPNNYSHIARAWRPVCTAHAKMRHIYKNFGLHELELKGPVFSVYTKIQERCVIWNSVIPWEGLRLKCSTMRAVCNTYMEKKDKHPNNYSHIARPWRPVCTVHGKMWHIYNKTLVFMSKRSKATCIACKPK